MKWLVALATAAGCASAPPPTIPSALEHQIETRRIDAGVPPPVEPTRALEMLRSLRKLLAVGRDALAQGEPESAAVTGASVATQAQRSLSGGGVVLATVGAHAALDAYALIEEALAASPNLFVKLEWHPPTTHALLTRVTAWESAALIRFHDQPEWFVRETDRDLVELARRHDRVAAVIATMPAERAEDPDAVYEACTGALAPHAYCTALHDLVRVYANVREKFRGLRQAP